MTGRRPCQPKIRHRVVVTPAATIGDLAADNFQGEHATAFLVKDRGLVVITSCGHAGVINSVRQVQKATGIEKVHAVVGGFHLAPAPEGVVAKTGGRLQGHQSRLHPPGPLLGAQYDHGGAPGAPGQADHALHGHPGNVSLVLAARQK
jgi:metal-dependent hydrolase (beta-lactamase superfamily II)